MLESIARGRVPPDLAAEMEGIERDSARWAAAAMAFAARESILPQPARARALVWALRRAVSREDDATALALAGTLAESGAAPADRAEALSLLAVLAWNRSMPRATLRALAAAARGLDSAGACRRARLVAPMAVLAGHAAEAVGARNAALRLYRTARESGDADVRREAESATAFVFADSGNAAAAFGVGGNAESAGRAELLLAACATDEARAALKSAPADPEPLPEYSANDRFAAGLALELTRTRRAVDAPRHDGGPADTRGLLERRVRRLERALEAEVRLVAAERRRVAREQRADALAALAETFAAERRRPAGEAAADASHPLEAQWPPSAEYWSHDWDRRLVPDTGRCTSPPGAGVEPDAAELPGNAAVVAAIDRLAGGGSP